MDVHINPTLKVFDFVNICRVCLTEEDVILLEQEHLKTALRNILNIDVQQDEVELPKHICKPCVKKIEDILSFISLANTCNAKLKEILSKNDNFCVFDDGEVSDNDSVKDEIRSENEIVHEIKVEGIKSDHDEETEWEEKPRRSRKKPSTCKKCNSKFNTAKELRKHQSQSAKCGSRKFSTKCEVCDENFQTVKKLREHQKENENCKANIHKCTICNKIFDMKSRLKTHLRVHTDEQPYECKICGKGFKFAQNRRRHDNIVHKGIKPFKCDICGKEFARLERILRHSKLHSLSKSCGYCGEVLKRGAEYQMHVIGHKLEDHHTKELIDSEAQFTCRFCSEPFSRRKAYHQHLIEHKLQNGDIQDTETKCSICDRILSSKYALQSHMVIHEGKKEFLCPTCGKAFLKKCYLDLHIKIHSGDKPYECKECGKKFRQASTFNTHTLVHTGQRLYKCEICKKTFKQSTHLRRHYLTHTGEKPFKCSYCNKTFAQNCNLKTHTRTHTGETPFHCPICNRGFYDTSSLKKHKQGHFKNAN